MRAMGLFGGTAVFCFLLLRASVAHSYYWTMDATSGCDGNALSTSSPHLCPLVNRTGNYRIGVLTSGCATFYLNGGATYENYVIKQSYTGSLYQDWNTFSQGSSSYNTLCVGAGNVLTNASMYDYLYYKEVRQGGGTVGMYTVTANNSL